MVARMSSTQNSSKASWSLVLVSKPPGLAWNWNIGGVDGEGICVAEAKAVAAAAVEARLSE
jgi:hypothetical protein